MGSLETSKPHIVIVPFPAQGHVNPMMLLAKLLHSRGFFITFVNTEFNHRRLIRSKGPDFVKGLPDFQFETIPEGLPSSDRNATQDLRVLCDSIRKHCLAPFVELLAKLNSSPQVPTVTCIISDGLMSFAIKAAEQLGIPEVQFWTASACSFMGYLHFSELVKRGIIPFQSETFLNEPIDWVPGMSNIRLRDFPSFVKANDPNDILFDYFGSEAQNCLKASTIIFNAFEEHLHVDPSKSMNSSLWKEDASCIEWLNKREPNSVVYVNYGSITVMSEKHLKEFAWGLANSKHPFLWIVRPDVVMGDSAILDLEFLKEIKERGLITSWCNQYEVLSHPSVGVFLTHCGWNSTVETISGGVPVICWPFFADQQTNCRYACNHWGIGMEVDHDVKRENIEFLVKEMMEGEEGKKKKEKALEWKKKAEEAVEVGGSSYIDFDRFVEEALKHG
ncbi:hypothetical protein CXB51_008637 [Gossypium anomalum]|uniref:Glycosyltransferase n=1 Tax=Gossypium anomalum TaxID=47600 RepID=A0A8J6D3L2_9ROSI|nr:hypothetical protein CXB51_008637 [Gossypium anomalum]